jgi:hypothetical protein
MGETRIDSLAMDAVADHLETAASDILLVSLNWPEPDGFSNSAAIDHHVESARLWTGSVIDRLTLWSKRARHIASALERYEAHRPAVDNFSADSP